MAMKDLIAKNRSYRRFYQDVKVPLEVLKELVGLARLSASAANLQPLRYILCSDSAKNAQIFPCLNWAGYLKDWAGPAEGERPGAYIVILGDTNISKSIGFDPGIAAQSILLGAVEKGLGGCMVGSIEREQLQQVLDVSSQYEIILVIAIGKPKETVVIDDVKSGDIKYWRDKAGVHHVPKRSVDELILGQF